jgi:hypothetical protein
LNGKGPKGPEAALKRCTIYREDRKRTKNYKQVLWQYKQDLRTEKQNAIRSFTAAHRRSPPPGTNLAAGDDTTWGAAGDNSREKIKRDPPTWHQGLEEEDARVTTPKLGAAPVAKDSRGALPPLGNSEGGCSFMRAEDQPHANSPPITRTMKLEGHHFSQFISTTTRRKSHTFELDRPWIQRAKQPMQYRGWHGKPPFLLASTAGQEGPHPAQLAASLLPLAATAGQEEICREASPHHRAANSGLINGDGASSRLSLLQPTEQKEEQEEPEELDLAEKIRTPAPTRPSRAKPKN